MTRPTFTESIVEDAALAWLESAGWSVLTGAADARNRGAGRGEGCGAVHRQERVMAESGEVGPVGPARLV